MELTDLLGHRRTYPVIRDDLHEQLLRVEPSRDLLQPPIAYRPCRVVLASGAAFDRVYVLDAAAYVQKWGVWPEDVSAKHALPLASVRSIAESPARLPPRLAEKLYAAGESGMGYSLFTLVLRDGRTVSCLTGNAVDFPALPDGVTPEMIVDAVPHAGERGVHHPPQPEYHWCLYTQPEHRP